MNFLRALISFPLRIKGKTYLRMGLLLGAYIVAYLVFGVFLASMRKGLYGTIVGTVFYPIERLSKAWQPGPSEGSDLSALTLKTLAVQPEEVLPRIDGAGSVEFFQKVEINAKTSGRIEQFFAKEGQVVRQGQTLVQLERVFLQLELTQQEAALQGARSELALATEKHAVARRGMEGRLKEIEKQNTLLKKLGADVDKMRATYEGKEILYQEGGISREEYGQMRTELIAREAAYRMAQKDLEIASIGFRDLDIQKRGLPVPEDPEKKKEVLMDINSGIEEADIGVARSKVNSAQAALGNTTTLLKETTIKSPVNGVVAQRNKSVGEQVLGGSAGNAAQSIMVLVDLNSVYATMDVKESDLKDLEKGQTMEFKVDVYPKETFKGTVEIILPVIDPKTHTLQVKALLKNPGLKLRPGMFIRASIITGKPRKLIVVPASAVLPQKENNAYVFVLRQGVLFRADVVTGRQYSDDRVEISSGLKEGDVIVTEKLPQLREGMRVQSAPAAP
ncbi:MAG: efflux RND transporter periplasmic adaptor subunit [Leptospirales bacterium]|nr:efflux RND transporter periplasmic adaptor subunit [Leptospirales bacterium]